MKRINFIMLTFIIFVTEINCGKNYKNKPNKNVPLQTITTEKYDPELRNLVKPFRMAKLNLVWAKAQQRLTEPKLKSLFTDLKIHDKEEIAWKQLNSQHKDKDGVKAGELRHKLIGIMSTYDLLEYFEETNDPVKTKPYKRHTDKSDNYMNKSTFRDKKLNKLWDKAEVSGFTPDELKALKEEFQHHQEKIDLYYNLLENIGNENKKTEYQENAINEEELESYNEIPDNNEDENDVIPLQKINKEQTENINQLRKHHHEIRDNFDRLERLTGRGPNSEDFIEPKVQGLWRVALTSNFSNDELSSLKAELHHYESRLLKLRHLHVEHAMNKEKYKNQKTNDKRDRFEDMEDHIKKQTRKVEKLHESVENRIFKHTEL